MNSLNHLLTMDEIDLYSDLDYEQVDGNLNEVSIVDDLNDKLERKNEKISKELEQVKEELARMTRINKILKTNISSLFKTAKAELERKNERIAQLTQQYDDLVFRRRKKSTNTGK